ncbi:sulfatase-like hydrolase/transferase [Gammaproteobacteria bacterium]|nr:sulfatase-like hydrolase/transferase [Gammaproteobacteria bacterium]MDB9841960.1 sulfatase-like hydrolase/transferase [Gammaproteobacteria bacterium]
MSSFSKNFQLLWIFLPFLYFIVGNFDDLSIFEILLAILFPVCISFLVILIKIVIAMTPIKEFQELIFTSVCLAIFMFFNYSLLGFRPIQFILISIILISFIPYLVQRSEEFKKILTITSLSMILICIFQVGFKGYQFFAVSGEQGFSDLGIKSLDQEAKNKLPNIYSIFLDAYSSSDQLAILGFNNSSLENTLLNNDFYVAQNAKSNFIKTDLSMYTFWSMEYPRIINNKPDINKRAIQNTALGNNNGIKLFRNLGYQYIRMGPNQSRLQDCSGFEDICLFQINSIDGAAGGMSSTIITQIFRMTPLYLVWYKYFSSSKRNLSLKSTLQDATNSLRSRASEFSAPYLVSIHVWQPHAPFIFQRNCEPHAVQIPYYRSWDRNGLNKEQNIDYYLQSTECTNKQLEELVNNIVASDPTAIIMIQSDHGHAFSMDLNLEPSQWTQEAIDARSSIFWAVKAPNSCAKSLYNSISSVNSLRFIFGCLASEDPVFLEDRTFIHNDTDFLQINVSND